MWMLAWLWLGVAGAADDEEVSLRPAVRVEPRADGAVELVPDRQVPRDASAADGVLLEFGDVSLYDLTVYFADVLRKNFMLADKKALEGKRVQFIGHDTMSVDASWEAYRSALAAHGYTAVTSGEVVTVVARGEAARGPLGVGAGDPGPTREFVTRLLPVRDASAADLMAVIRPLLSSDAQLTAYAPANTLIVTDVGDNVSKVAEVVERLDIAAPASHLAIVHLEHAQASEVKAVIEALYPTEPAKTAPKSQKKPRRGQKAPAEPTASGSEARHISTVLHDERTNTLIVLANPQGHAAVAEVVAELDMDIDASGRSSLHVIQLTYAMAEEVAAVLTSLQSSAKAEPRRAIPAKGSSKTDEPDLGAALDGNARIAADPATNALVIVAEPRDFEPLQTLVAQLDVARGQVFVDAVFVELTHTDGRELSLAAHVTPSDGQPITGSLTTSDDLNTLSVSPDLLSGLAAGVFGPLVDVIGVGGETLSVPTFGIALRALQTHSDVQIMGNPALLALDHEEGTLTVGRKIPYKSQSSPATALGIPIATYERMDVAMDLVVTPHINDSELVTLDIELGIDEVEGTASESDNEGGPVTSGRKLTSRVQVLDGQTIVIAGMTGTKLEVGETKVPILGDIPILGALFRGRTRHTRSTNLMVFLTPHVVEHPSDLLEIRRIKEAQRAEFTRRFQGKEGQEWLDELVDLVGGAPPST